MVPKKYLILMAMVGTLVSLDQLTKFLIISSFHYGETRVVLAGFFNLTLVYNTGAAFGLLANLPEAYRDPFFLIVPVLTLLVILGVFYRLRHTQVLSAYSFSLIVGGALGNLVDRLRLGHVVDFLDFHISGDAHFPAFNLADSAITVGVALLFLSLLFEKESRKA